MCVFACQDHVSSFETQPLKLKHEIVEIRTTQESQGSVLEAATDWTITGTVALFADLLSTLAAVTESGADVLDTVILTATTDWTNSLEFADLMSTVAAVTGSEACVVDTVITPATDWTSSLAFADISTVAAGTGFRTCLVSEVLSPATSWAESVAFWTSDTRRESKNIVRLIFTRTRNLLYAVLWRAQMPRVHETKVGILTACSSSFFLP